MRLFPFSAFAIFLVANAAQAQVTLSLSSGSGTPGTPVTLNLSLSSTGTQPASLQWTFAYPAAAISNLSVVAGATATNAGKSLSCAAGASPGTMNCIVFGLNTTGMANGVVAQATFTISSSTLATSAAVQVNSPVAAAGDGSAIPATATGNTITIIQSTPVLVASLSCSPVSIQTPGSSTCTVTLNQAAPAGGSVVTLSDNSANLTVPASVTVAAGSTSNTFAATATQVAADVVAQVTASLNASSQNTNLTLVAPVASAVPSSLSCAPPSLTSGGASTCTVTLTNAAPAGGLSVALSSNTGLLTVPASVTVAAGATMANFSATAGTITTSATATVTASANSVSRTANITLNSPVQPTGLTCSPATIATPGSSTCTVTLSQAAPAGGAGVTLSDNSANLSVPASVTVAAGSASNTFAATATQVAADAPAQVSATYGGVTQNFTLTLSAPVSPSGVTCAPTTLSSGGVSTCTVTLNKAAPAGGLLVALSSNSGLLTVPASVTVAASATSANFSATAGAITTSSTATVTATAIGISRSATITLAPATSLSSLACSPATIAAPGSSTCTVTLAQAAPAGGAMVTLSDNSANLSVPASVTVAAGSTSNTFVATATQIAADTTAQVSATYGGVTQNFTLTLSAPASLSGVTCAPATLSSGGVSTCTVTLTKAAPAGGLLVALSSNSGLLTVPASVTVAASAATANFSATAGTITTASTATVTAAANGVSRSAAIALASNTQLSGITCSPAAIATPGSTTCTATLSQAAPAGGAVIALAANSPNLSVPASVTVASGATSTTFTASATQVAVDTIAQVTGSYSGVTQNATLTLSAPTALSSLSCIPAALSSGAAAACTVTLSKAAPAPGVGVALSSDSGMLSVPPSVTVTAGATTASFPATAGTITASATATVTASANGVSRSVAITLSANSQLSGLICSPATIATPGSTSCTVTLSQAAPAGGATVTLGTSNPALSVPASVTVASGTTTATFGATAAQLASDVTVQVSASYGGASVTFAIALSGPNQLQSFTCSAAVLAAGGSADCTVTLAKPAAASGLVISLSSSQPSIISLPPSLTVPAGATTGTVQAVAASNIQGSQSVVLSASLAGSSITATIAVSQNSQLSSFSCASLALEASATTDCTIGLSLPAPAGGSTVSLSGAGLAPLVIPSSVQVAAGSSTAVFSIKAGAVIASDLNVPIVATLGGSSLTVTVKLLGPVALSGLQCSGSDVEGGTPINCTVTVSRAPTFNMTVSLSSDSATATVPASVQVPSGSSTASFSVVTSVVASPVTATLTASLDASSRSVTLQVRPVSSTPSLTLSCTPATITAEGTARCIVLMSHAAPPEGAQVQVAGDATIINTPATVRIEGGQSSATFDVSPKTIDRDGAATVTVAFGSATASARLTLEALKPTSLACSPKQLSSSDSVLCTLRLNSSSFSQTVNLAASSNNANLLVPAALVTRAKQTNVTFLAQFRTVSSQQDASITVSFGGASVKDTVTVVPPRFPIVTAPAFRSVHAGTLLEFTVSAQDPHGLAFVLSVERQPEGAILIPRTGEFRWTPRPDQAGLFRVDFVATNLEQQSARQTVQIEVVGDLPVISAVNDAASWTTVTPCSPSGLATVVGAGLTPHDPEVLASLPAPTVLAGARVRINGSFVPLLYSSTTQINFQCPDLPAGTSYSLTVENSNGASQPYFGTIVAAVPGIFTVNGSGSGPGAILVGGTATLAQARNPFYSAQPSQPGDTLSIFATGLGGVDVPVASGAPAPVDPLARVVMPLSVWIGGAIAEVPFAGLAPGFVGLYQVNAVVPASSETGNSVPLRLELTDTTGKILTSNRVSVAVETPLP